MEKRVVFENFSNALERLEEAVNEAQTELEIDGAIQRFEFTFEQAWKSIKKFLEDEGIICRSPKSCLKEAYAVGFINNEQIWLKMLTDRNRSVHIYDMETSREVFENIKRFYVQELKALRQKLISRMD
jgi:nucleotidyltransferase substrate binding protein (TIGR01987 family)